MIHRIALGLMLLPLTGLASQALEEDTVWAGSAEFGFNQSSGNTDSDSFLGRLKLQKTIMNWRNELKFEAMRSSENGARTKQNLLVEGQADRKLTESRYAFGNARLVDDQFGGFRRQASFAAGYGWNLLNSERTVLNVEAGLGYRHSEEQESGESFSEPVILSSGKLDYQWTDTTRLINEFRLEGGPDNTFIENEVGARVKINSALGLKVSYIVRHNTDVPPETEETDTLTAFTLDYQF